MLREFDDAMRSAAELVANIDRDVRRKLVRVTGREERYSEKFVTLLEERLGGFHEGGLSWQVSTHISDKQSGEETATGADLFVSIEMDFRGASVQKGFQAQAKINKNRSFGLAVDSRTRLLNQCKAMLQNSDSSFVFAYGEQETKILHAQSVVEADGISPTHLTTQRVSEFFYEFFVCRKGDRELFANTAEDLQNLTRKFHYAASTLIKVSDSRAMSRIRPRPVRRPRRQGV